MFIETDFTNKVKALLEEDLITNLNIFGVIENCNEAKILVDDINNPSGVVVNNGYLNYIYTNNDEFVDKVIDYLSNNKGEYGFSALRYDIAQKIKGKFEMTWGNVCSLYYYNKNTVDKSKIKAEVTDVKIEDDYVVNEYYTYKDDSSIHDIRNSIYNRVSSCVYKNGKLASWLLIHDDNSMGPMYTKEEFRKEGYAVDATLDLVNKLLKNNKIPFLHIVKGNEASYRLAKKCGFVEHGTVDWFGIIV